MQAVATNTHNSNTRRLLNSNRHLLITLAVLFLVSWSLLTYLIYQVEKDNAFELAEQQVHNHLYVHRALHSYVEDIQKPEIYRLQKSGKLYEEYFSPKLLSSTYIARNLQQNLQVERIEHGLPRIHFKIASNNARNPINQADEFELEILHKMNDRDIKEYSSVINYRGGKFFYMAFPVAPNRQSCMRCHDDPSTAPKEMIKQYGDQRGFYEKLGNIRAMISISIPFDPMLENARNHTVKFSAGSLAIFIFVFSVITYFIVRLDREQKKGYAQNIILKELSNTDELTQLNNRRKFNADLDNEIEQARRYKTIFSIILLDIDYFKKINDKHGHLVGDEILVQLSRLMKQEIRIADRCARWGGEEFIILLSSTTMSGATKLANKLRTIFKRHHYPHGIKLTASFGSAEYQQGEENSQLLKRLDSAMYRAKDQGRDRVV